MPSLTYNDMLSAYQRYPAPIRPYLLRAETHPTLRALLTKSHMRILIDIIARAPIADPCRQLTFRVEKISDDLDVSTKTVSRALNFLRGRGWLTRHLGCDGRNNWGEFCAGDFVLGDELRAMLGLPTAEAAVSRRIQPSPANETSEPSPTLPNHAEVSGATISLSADDSTGKETKMSDGLYRVNNVFEKEASFEHEASDEKAKNQSRGVAPARVPADLIGLQTELGIDPKGICKLMKIAKESRQWLQHVWIAKREHLLAAGATGGRAVNYLEFLLKTGEDFAFRAQKRAIQGGANAPAQAQTESKPVDVRIYWNKRYHGGNNVRVRIHGDGSASVSDATRSNAYVRPADMEPIYSAIQAGKLSLVEE